MPTVFNDGVVREPVISDRLGVMPRLNPLLCIKWAQLQDKNVGGQVLECAASDLGFMRAASEIADLKENKARRNRFLVAYEKDVNDVPVAAKFFHDVRRKLQRKEFRNAVFEAKISLKETTEGSIYFFDFPFKFKCNSSCPLSQNEGAGICAHCVSFVRLCVSPFLILAHPVPPPSIVSKNPLFFLFFLE